MICGRVEPRLGLFLRAFLLLLEICDFCALILPLNTSIDVFISEKVVLSSQWPLL